MHMKICFTYNVKKPEGENTNQEYDSPIVINTIKTCIEELGHSVLEIEADEDAFNKLRENKSNIDLVFNIAEGLKGDARESQIPLYCEILNIPYSHSNPTTNALTLDKHFTKLVLKGSGIQTPDFKIVESTDNLENLNLNYPLIVKPNSNGSSLGIFNDSVVDNFDQLKKAVNKVLTGFDKEALIEEFIDGREFTVSLLGNDDIQVLPIVEQKFDFMPKGAKKIAGYELKWIYEDNLTNLHDAYACPPELDSAIEKDIQETAKQIYKVLNVKDCARVDFRMNAQNKLYFIEINTLPGINPNENEISYFPIASRAAGMKYKDLIEKILTSAIKRYYK